MKRIFILTLKLTQITALLLAPLAVRSASDEPKPARPNILLIISDDQGAGDYGYMGHPLIRTPHLDKLAAQSLLFVRGNVPTSLCCPSLASIITGLYPHQHKITANDPPADASATKGKRGSSPEQEARWDAALDQVPTLPRLLADEGYLSFQTGKWWHGDFTRGGFTHGMTKGTRHGDAGLTIGREGLQPIYDFVADARQQKRPFMLWYAPFMPHTPHTPPERLFQKYASQTPSPHIARYMAMCEWFDETCGELLGYLDREGLTNNTIVVYVTDNGWVQSPDRAAFAPKNKTTPFDLGHRTPIMVRWPGKVNASRSESLASSTDIMPTMLAAIGLPKPANLHGINLLDEKAVAGRKHVFGECFTVRSQSLDDPSANLLWRWVTDGRWRLILPRTCETDEAFTTIPRDSYLTSDLHATLSAAKPMLYDLPVDPTEDRNLADNHPDIVASLRSQLDALWIPENQLISSFFVYGTLKTGQCREKYWPIRPQRIVKAWIEAALYDTGPYPAIDVGHDLVGGELWTFLPPDMAGVLRALDEVEGYREVDTDSDLYRREVIQCETVEGDRAFAFSYFYARSHEFVSFRRLPPTYDFAGRRFAVWPEGADW